MIVKSYGLNENTQEELGYITRPECKRLFIIKKCIETNNVLCSRGKFVHVTK